MQGYIPKAHLCLFLRKQEHVLHQKSKASCGLVKKPHLRNDIMERLGKNFCLFSKSWATSLPTPSCCFWFMHSPRVDDMNVECLNSFSSAEGFWMKIVEPQILVDRWSDLSPNRDFWRISLWNLHEFLYSSYSGYSPFTSPVNVGKELEWLGIYW